MGFKEIKEKFAANRERFNEKLREREKSSLKKRQKKFRFGELKRLEAEQRAKIAAAKARTATSKARGQAAKRGFFKGAPKGAQRAPARSGLTMAGSGSSEPQRDRDELRIV